jgi:hypothetical protein
MDPMYCTMTRRIFFSFHVESDLWRANQLRAHLLPADVHQVGFFDPQEYEALLRARKSTIGRVIRERLLDTSVTIVLIGSETASRPFVHLAIEESLANRNGLLGIRIHDIDGHDGKPGSSGPEPILPDDVAFPTYTWDWDLERLMREIDLAEKRADRWRSGFRVRR